MMSNKNRLDIQAGLRTFLIDLYEHWYNQKRVPLTGINEFFVLRLQTTIEQLFGYYLDLIQERIKKDRKFLKRVQDWFVAQEWSFTFQLQDYEMLARQASYLLINKIILYSALQQQWENLDKLSISADMKRGGKLIHVLKGYFDDVLKVDYQTIFSTDRLDIGFPEEEYAVEVIRILIEDLNRYNLAGLGYEIIGSLFERLIPRVERHKLGQYFTPAEVVDLMLVFCSHHVDDVILDPAAGAGTFLVRAYQYKHLESYRTNHEDLLKLLWGCDIDPFPAHLAAINLAVRGLDSRVNFPRILHRDFFRITPTTLYFPIPLVEELNEGLWTTETEVSHEEEHPDLFDVIVGNPPYTRQEFLGDLMPSETYKKDLVKQVFQLSDGTQLASFSKRAGLHAYFFVHGYKFLKEGGRLAFITSNSWLNADYGSGLQAFLLNHFKILAIIESDKESWFPAVKVDNCIVILEKCSGIERSSERNANWVQFVRFHVPLVPDIIDTMDDDQNQRKRFNTLKRIADLILAYDQPIVQEQFHVYPKRQGDLLNEGTDLTNKRYVGSRWAKFTTAPTIWYKIIHSSHKMISLSELVDVHYGLKTGANEFFYQTEETIQKYGIEPTYWGTSINGHFIQNAVMKSPLESKTVHLDWASLKLRVLLLRAPVESLISTHAWPYIQAGESMGWHERSTSQQRHRNSTSFGWYDLGEVPRTTILWPELSGAQSKKKVFCSDVPIIANSKLYALSPHDPSLQDVLVAILNSTLVDFLSEFVSTSYGGWAGAPSDISLQAVKQLSIPDIRSFTTDQRRRLQEAFYHYKSRPVGSLAEEYGITDSAPLSLNSIASDLRCIDLIIMGEVLDLTEQEQLEIYQTIFALSTRRMEKVKRAGKQQPRDKTKREIDEEAFITAILAYAEGEIRQVNTLYQQILAGRETKDIQVISPQNPPFRGKPLLKEGLWDHELILGPRSEIYPSSQYGEARYRQAWALVRIQHVKMPIQIDTMVSEVQTLITALEKLIKVVDTYTTKVLDARVRKQLNSRIWTTIKQQLTDLSGGFQSDNELRPKREEIS